MFENMSLLHHLTYGFLHLLRLVYSSHNWFIDQNLTAGLTKSWPHFVESMSEKNFFAFQFEVVQIDLSGVVAVCGRWCASKQEDGNCGDANTWQLFSGSRTDRELRGLTRDACKLDARVFVEPDIRLDHGILESWRIETRWEIDLLLVLFQWCSSFTVSFNLFRHDQLCSNLSIAVHEFKLASLVLLWCYWIFAAISITFRLAAV